MRARELAALIARQSRDDQTWRLRARRREVRSCDLGPDGVGQAVLDCGPDRRPSTLIGSSKIWGAAEASFVPGSRCPACGNAIRPDRDHHCLVCNASSRDPRQHRSQAPPPETAAPVLAGGRGWVRVRRKPRTR